MQNLLCPDNVAFGMNMLESPLLMLRERGQKTIAFPCTGAVPVRSTSPGKYMAGKRRQRMGRECGRRCSIHKDSKKAGVPITKSSFAAQSPEQLRSSHVALQKKTLLLQD